MVNVMYTKQGGEQATYCINDWATSQDKVRYDALLAWVYVLESGLELSSVCSYRLDVVTRCS